MTNAVHGLHRTLLPVCLSALILWVIPSMGMAMDYHASDTASEASLGTGRRNGAGTRSSPWWGDFDSILKGLPAGATLHLDGTFFTRGTHAGEGARLRKGQSLMGSGRMTTTLRMVLAAEQTALTVVLQGAEGAAGITVADLTVDAGATNALPGTYLAKRNGVNLSGDGCVMRNVRAVRCFGRLKGGQECFALKIFGGRDGLIEGCEVSDVRGDYCSAIGLRGGEIRNNVVIFPSSHPAGSGSKFFWFGYNCEDSTNVWVHHNQSLNGTAGFYVDTGITHQLTVSDNLFTGAKQGVYLNMIVDTRHRSPPRGVDGCSITNNRIHLNPTLPVVIGILLDHTTLENNACDVAENFIQHVLISRNEIGYAPGVTPPILAKAHKQAVSVASNVAFRPGATNALPVGINDVLVVDNILQEQPPGSGGFVYRNKVLPECSGQPGGNAANVRGRDRTASARERQGDRVIQWEP